MRFVEMAALLFVLQLSFAMVNTTGLYEVSKQPQDEWIADVDNEELADASYVQSQVSSENNFGFGDFIKGLWYFVKALGWGVISIPYTLGVLGLKAPFSYYISACVYFIYFIAIAQFIRGMDVEKK